MIRRLIDRFRWWLKPGDVLRVNETLVFFPLNTFSTRLITLRQGTLVVVTEDSAYPGLISSVMLGRTFDGQTVALFSGDIRQMTRVRRHQVDLT